jgi:hypothetical protein
MIFVFAVFLPVAFVIGITARKTIPAMEKLPAVLVPPSPEFSHQIYEKNNLWPDLNILTRLYADSLPLSIKGEAVSRLALELHPQVYLKIADILVYWTESQPVDFDRLPEKTFLIGILADRKKRRYLLPDRASESDGWIILYSLAQQKWVGAASLPTYSVIIKGDFR